MEQCPDRVVCITPIDMGGKLHGGYATNVAVAECRGCRIEVCLTGNVKRWAVIG